MCLTPRVQGLERVGLVPAAHGSTAQHRSHEADNGVHRLGCSASREWGEITPRTEAQHSTALMKLTTGSTASSAGIERVGREHAAHGSPAQHRSHYADS